MSDLTITHNATEGTMIGGTSRGDGSAAVLKANGWRWSRTLGSWYVPRSRDQRANGPKVAATTRELESAGFAVAVDVDNTQRTTAEIEANKSTHERERADYLARKATTAAEHADQAHRSADELAEQMPLGQPILTDHYSAPKMRRAYDRIHRAQDRAVQAHRDAQDIAARAATASHATGARYNPRTVANRIDRLEAQIRDSERKMAGYTNNLGDQFLPAAGGYRDRLEQEAAQTRDELAYWQEIRGQQLANGTAANYNRQTIRAGDEVRFGRNNWWTVVRANAKTVTVESHGCSIRAPYHQIDEHQPVLPEHDEPAAEDES